MPQRYSQLARQQVTDHEDREDWFSGVAAIVAEADPATMSVKCVIPEIDEHRVHDEWIPVLTPFVGKPGYGAAFIPALGSEVVLFSWGSEGLTLYAIPRFNELYTAPPEFADGSRGCKCDTVLRLLCDLLIEIRSQTQVQVQAGQEVNADAPDVRLRAGGAVGVHTQGAKVGFLGAAPVARQQLPGPAVDLETCKTLANALRAALISFGLGGG
jgi:hypothetical protein